MTLHEQQSHFAHDIAKLITYIYEEDFVCTFGEAFRTPEQAALYAKRGIGIKNSPHCDRLAMDIFIWRYDPEKFELLEFKEWEQFGKYWESLDDLNRWGGYFKNMIDMVHFERKKQ